MIECLVNGEISTLVETSNRGLNYGDGLFETLSGTVMAVHAGGRPYGSSWAGCERLGMTMPPQAILLREVQTVSAGMTDAVVKIVVTTGGEGRGYMPLAGENPVRIVSALPLPRWNC